MISLTLAFVFHYPCCCCCCCCCCLAGNIAQFYQLSCLGKREQKLLNSHKNKTKFHCNSHSNEITGKLLSFIKTTHTDTHAHSRGLCNGSLFLSLSSSHFTLNGLEKFYGGQNSNNNNMKCNTNCNTQFTGNTLIPD